MCDRRERRRDARDVRRRIGRTLVVLFRAKEVVVCLFAVVLRGLVSVLRERPQSLAEPRRGRDRLVALVARDASLLLRARGASLRSRERRAQILGHEPRALG